MKKNKKAFTLVELLVVIAILAILATVSILGYTSFTDKAKKSVAEDELLQIKTVLLADWLDGFVGEPENRIAITKSADYYTITGVKDVDGKTEVIKDESGQLSSALTKAVEEALSGQANLKVSASSNGSFQGHLFTNLTFKFNGNQLESVEYKCANGKTATWTIKDDKITSDNAK